MKISRKMMHPEVRNFGAFLRRILPGYSLRTFHMMNKLTDSSMKGKAPSKKINYKQVYIDRPDGTKMRMCVFTPKVRKEQVPGLLWMHGGGYAMGLPEQAGRYAEQFILASGCVVVAPAYTRSLDAPFPAALDDCYLALQWLKEHGMEYGVKSDQLFVGGESAGGSLAAALSLYARDKGEISIAFQMPLYPMLDDHMATESMKENNAPVWNLKSNRLAWKLYLGEDYGTEHVSKYAAPGRETDYHNLPPILTFVGGVEPFRDETVEYVRKLKEAGVQTVFRVYGGCFHAFDRICEKTSIAKESTEFLMNGFTYAVKHFTKE